MKKIIKFLSILLLIFLMISNVNAEEEPEEENQIYWKVVSTASGYQLVISSKPIEGNSIGGGVFTPDPDAPDYQYHNHPWGNFSYNMRYGSDFIKSVKIGGEDDIVKPVITAYWFQNFDEITEIDLTYLDTSEVTNMKRMFENCTKLKKIIVGNLDTSKVTDMSYMFNQCSNLEGTLDLSGWNTNRVENMEAMFSGCSKLESIDISSFNIASNASAMFKNCSKLEEIKFNNSSGNYIRYAASMFQNCSSLITLDISSFSLKDSYTVNEMFRGCENLETIKVSKNWKLNEEEMNQPNVPYGKNMFEGCTKLVGKYGTIYNSSHTAENYAIIETFTTPGYLTDEDKYIFNWAVDGNNCDNPGSSCKLTISNNEIEGEHFDSGISFYKPDWNKYNTSITEVVVGGSNDIITPPSTVEWFKDLDKLITIDLRYLDMSKVLRSWQMFDGASELEIILVSNDWNASINTFYGAPKLAMTENNNYYWKQIPDYIYWAVDGENCTSNNGNCKLTISNNEITGEHYDSGHLFYATRWDKYNKSIKEIKIGGDNDIISLRTIKNWFKDMTNLETIDLKYLDTSNMTDFNYLFQGCNKLKNVYFNNIGTSKVTSMEGMFYGCKSLSNVDFSSIDTSKVTNMSYMFSGSGLTNIDSLNLDTSNVTNMSYMFENCSNLSNVSLSYLNTSKVTDMSYLFSGSGIASIDLNNVNTTKLDTIKYMFNDCNKLTSINFGNFDTSHLTSMSGLFKNCSSLSNIDLSKLNTSNILYMGYMFAGCTNLKTINLKSFDTSSLQYMQNMFADSGITSLDLSNFDTSNVVNMSSLFENCSNLTSINLNNFNTSKVTSMYHMFNGCSSLKKLNLSSFAINKSISNSNYGSTYMFSGTDSLKTIYVSNEKQSSFFSKYKEPQTTIEFVGIDFKIKNVNGNSLEISWDKVEVVKYVIYRSEKKDRGFKKIATTTDNTYVDKNLTYGKTYYYYVSYYYLPYYDDVLPNTSRSNIYSKKVVPSKLNASIKSAGTNNVKLSWNKLNVTGYEVYRSTDNKKWTKVTTITKGSTTSYNNKKLKANKKYYYKVRAYKTVNGKKIYGKYSDVINAKTAPVKPTIKLTIKDYESMNLKITPSKGATYYIYKIYFDKEFNDLWYEAYIFDTITPISNQDLGATYYYRVKACNSENRCSGWTTASLKQTTKTPSFSLSTTSKKVTITLNKVNGAEGYQLYSSTSKNGTYKLLEEFSSEEEIMEFIHKTTKGKTYYYKVRSYALNYNDKRIYSPFSGIKSIKSK